MQIDKALHLTVNRVHRTNLGVFFYHHEYVDAEYCRMIG